MLAAGPADAGDVGRRLAAAGITRARDPATAVRRALRDDTRVVELADGRLASIDQALTGIDLTTRVTPVARDQGWLEIEPDLAPLTVLGLGPTVDLPAGVRAGEIVAVRVDDALGRAITIRAIAEPAPRPDDEAAVVDGVRRLLALWGADADADWGPPAIAHLATVAVSVAADDPRALRVPGRPLSEVVADAGYEAHLGWAGRAGTDWSVLTEDEAELLEAEAASLLMDERPGEAAMVQERLLTVLRHHMPERVPAARRRLARTLARAGRPEDAVAALTAGDVDDPEDWYEAAVVAHRAGDERRARRWVQSGLARLGGDAHTEIERCLADLEGDLDAQARYLTLRDELDGLTPDPDGARWLARAVAGLSRSYLVESLLEELAVGSDRGALDTLIAHLADQGDLGRDVCLAMGQVLPRGIARRALDAAGSHTVPAGAAVAGLVDARPERAWTTRASDAPDQRQVVVTVARGDGRVSPLVALIDIEEMGGALKDGFFLPDMIEERLRRELFEPMEELGLACHPIPLAEGIAAISDGLDIARRIGWRMPSLSHQPVVDRLLRLLP